MCSSCRKINPPPSFEASDRSSATWCATHIARPHQRRLEAACHIDRCGYQTLEPPYTHTGCPLSAHRGALMELVHARKWWPRPAYLSSRVASDARVPECLTRVLEYLARTTSQRNKGISELYWVTLEQPKSGTIREIWVPDIAINYVYDEPMCGLKRFNALNS